MSHISALYIPFNLNYHRKTLSGLSMLRKFTRNWPMTLSPPGDVYIWSTVHNCILQLSKVCEHYVIQKFVKFTTLCVRQNAVYKYDFCIFMGKFTFCKQIVKQYYISSIFSLCYCQIGKRLWWTVCCLQCHLFQANVLYVISFWINVFQPAPGAVYLGGVQRLMTYIIIWCHIGVNFPRQLIYLYVILDVLQTCELLTFSANLFDVRPQ